MKIIIMCAISHNTQRIRLSLLVLILIALQAVLIAGVLRRGLQCAIVRGIKGLHIIAKWMRCTRVLAGLNNTRGLRHTARGISAFTTEIAYRI